ncbi:hypothetical protein V1512DRAFT_265703 [Lipomyces arxii]|uniref:uncharacterized protein n=1 Tax=Lipomyces arxii TaxID=56418 RepID=UPI0034CD034E
MAELGVYTYRPDVLESFVRDTLAQFKRLLEHTNGDLEYVQFWSQEWTRVLTGIKEQVIFYDRLDADLLNDLQVFTCNKDSVFVSGISESSLGSSDTDYSDYQRTNYVESVAVANSHSHVESMGWLERTSRSDLLRIAGLGGLKVRRTREQPINYKRPSMLDEFGSSGQPIDHNQSDTRDNFENLIAMRTKTHTSNRRRQRQNSADRMYAVTKMQEKLAKQRKGSSTLRIR